MRLIVARMSAVYSGRIGAVLDEGVRLVLCKADGAVQVQADVGAYRPLVWMDAPNLLTVKGHDGATSSPPLADGDMWVITNRAEERLAITFHEVHQDIACVMDSRKGLVLDGVEAELQALLAEHPTELEDGLTLVTREHETGIGPVDLWCRDTHDVPVAVELKRQVDSLGPVEQLTRYLERLRAGHPNVRGILAAQRVVPQARTLCDDRGITWVEVDLDRLRGLESVQPGLF